MAAVVSTGEAVVSHLEALYTPEQPMGIAWDADGTLWSGDVGEDTFEYLIDEVGLKAEVTDALDAFATLHGIAPERTPSHTARTLLDAFRAGQLADLPACELMTWAFAGFSTGSVRSIARKAFSRASLDDRKQRLVEPVLRWARDRRMRLVVVSASPQIVVEEAAAGLWGFAPTEIIGARARIANGIFTPELEEPVPFAGRKKDLAQLYFEDALWLASFGDNFFDLELLRAARLGIAVRPKPALLAKMDRDDSLLILDDRGAEERTLP